MPSLPLWITRIIHPENSTCALGSISLAGTICNSRGQGQGPGRRLGRYGLVYSLRGTCRYRDDCTGARQLVAGDLLLLFPDVEHRYGGAPGERWDEFFLVFEGPVFDLWRERGLLNPRRPVFPLHPVEYWLRRLMACVPDRPDSALLNITHLQLLLAEILGEQSRDATLQPTPQWLTAAQTALTNPGTDGPDPRAVAVRLGMAPETFRKNFTAAMGVSPSRFRREHRIREAGRLLRDTEKNCSEIAEVLGFSDVYHFSKAFKAATGLAPAHYRRRLQADDTLANG